ncbi:hypothetical protein LWI28_014946 [Acer negundo]|uniref:Uncharacterized protein n=1 Tax=Acer negundo TaxID=4023 RepID=A0AAD5NY04_ACENE|nr:hypothetical protein LWI28_014946 [Acer negundo]
MVELEKAVAWLSREKRNSNAGASKAKRDLDQVQKELKTERSRSTRRTLEQNVLRLQLAFVENRAMAEIAKAVEVEVKVEATVDKSFETVISTPNSMSCRMPLLTSISDLFTTGTGVSYPAQWIKVARPRYPVSPGLGRQSESLNLKNLLRGSRTQPKASRENTAFSLCRRSNRNLCIGSGFQNKSSDPVHIIDEEEEEDETVGQVEIPPVGGETLDPSFDYRLYLDFVCKDKDLSWLRMVYQILDSISLSLPYRDQEVYNLHAGTLLIHAAEFECGVRLPFHPTLRRALVALGLAPLQTSSSFWKYLMSFLVLWKEQCERDGLERGPGFDKLRYVFQIANMMLGPKGQFYLRAYKSTKLVIPRPNTKFNIS